MLVYIQGRKTAQNIPDNALKNSFEKKSKKFIFVVDSWYGFDLYTAHQRGRRAAGDNIARS